MHECTCRRWLSLWPSMTEPTMLASTYTFRSMPMQESCARSPIGHGQERNCDARTSHEVLDHIGIFGVIFCGDIVRKVLPIAKVEAFTVPVARCARGIP